MGRESRPGDTIIEKRGSIPPYYNKNNPKKLKKA
jgi:hypothetical protein